MHGSICCIVKKFVDIHHGDAAWQEILGRSGNVGLQLSPVGDYPDAVVISMLEAACELLDCKLHDLLQSIGRFAAPELISFAGSMLHPEWRTFEILANVETLIHRTVRMLNPTAQPANIQAFRLDEQSAQVVYSSRRGLCSLARGILEGLGESYGEELSVHELTCCQQGHPFCTFEVKRVPATVDIPGTAPESSNEETDSSMVTETRPFVFDDPDCMQVSPEPEIPAADSSPTPTSGSMIRGSSVDSSILPFPKRCGRYTIQEIIGVGGMGVVYRGIDESLGRVVAIKTLKSVSVDRELADVFLEEARAMARLTHENVVRVYDVGVVDTRPYFVMEYLTGKPLSQRISLGALPVTLAARLMLQLSSGVDAMHRIGMVHRDIKPDNILLSSNSQRCHLLDFGLAGVADKDDDKRRKVSGTIGYIAPERLKGYPADYRSDWFSVGCVGYEMLTGNRAFESFAKNMGGPKNLFGTESGNWAGVPDALRQLIIGMLDTAPEQRTTDVELIRMKLDHVIADSTVDAGQKT
jgi:hypothetical protein